MDQKLSEIKTAIEKLVNSQAGEQSKDAISELKRLGKELNPEELKAILSCNCGPSGEHPIEPWP